MVDHEVQLEAIEPPHAGLAPRGQAVEHLVAVDAAVVADGELGRVGEVDAGLLAAEAVQQHHHGDEQPRHQAQADDHQRGAEGSGRRARHGQPALAQVLKGPAPAAVREGRDPHTVHGTGALQQFGQRRHGGLVLHIDVEPGLRHLLEQVSQRQRGLSPCHAELHHLGVGVIADLPRAVGDAVQAGQGLVVMEAMKMENELRTAAAGTVRAVRTRPGVAVEKGAVLVELD